MGYGVCRGQYEDERFWEVQPDYRQLSLPYNATGSSGPTSGAASPERVGLAFSPASASGNTGGVTFVSRKSSSNVHPVEL